ncbi:unnamed protein product [Hydatigera taeniaeformis]|uniref:histone acetyltransferase n=1 Tax=Hydatigena taeniaeformis TaxID=6205 RepID=A0A0R3WP50_HYDTA|nr:unnamed protein product [Hydatigera taeniaeformis]
MKNLEVIPGIFNVTDDSDGVVRMHTLKEQLRLLLHSEWCLFLRTPLTICTDPHCPKIRNVFRHIVNCTAGMNCKLPQCPPAKQLVFHFYSCEDQQCPVCDTMRFALEKRFYPIERDGEDTNRDFNLTMEERCDVIRAMALLTAGTPDLTNLHLPGMEHAIRCAKYFEDNVYAKANSLDQYACQIANYAMPNGQSLDKYWSL